MTGQPRILAMADFTACPTALAPLQAMAEVQCLPADQSTFDRQVKDFDAYIASLEVQVTQAVLESAPRLKVIATPSTGRDHIDEVAARECGVVVLSLKDESELLNSLTATAELAWGLLLSVVRQLPGAVAAARNGDWARDRFRGRQLSDKTLGVIGYGRLGKMVAQFGRAFRMKVLVCDRKPIETPVDIRQVELTELLALSDVVSVHVHLSPENCGLLGEHEFAKMKEGTVLINTSRGAVIDEGALLRSLKSGRLGGAGLDVVHGEWRSDLEKHPLIEYARDHDNLVITPHIGGVTFESQQLALQHTVRMLMNHMNLSTES